MKTAPDLKKEIAVAESASTTVSVALARPFLHLFENGLNDIHAAETHLLKVLPKMAKAAASAELRVAFEDHLKQTEEQVSRLDSIFTSCELKHEKGNCEGLEAITDEGDGFIVEYPSGGLRDVCLIITAQKVEHYEIATYGSLRAIADLLHFHDAAALLDTTLNEEEEADKMLSRISKTVNVTASKVMTGSMDGHDAAGNKR